MITEIQLMKCNQMAEQILHTPGNFRKDILEMTIVLDNHMDAKTCESILIPILRFFKQHNEVFRTVRLNVTAWREDNLFTNEIIPMSVLLWGHYFETYLWAEQIKSIDSLISYLRMFHARSKLILLLTDNSFTVECNDKIQEELKPFLGKKLMIIAKDNPENKIGIKHFISILS